MTQPREQDRIVCLECGKYFRALPKHMRHAHGMSDEDYRLKFMIPKNIPLVCIGWSDNQRRKNIETNRSASIKDNQHVIPRGNKHSKSSKSANKKSRQEKAAKATKAAALIDKTAERRKQLEPYPVTVDQAAERLDCTKQIAYKFLWYCVKKGKLKRIKRGLYGSVDDSM